MSTRGLNFLDQWLNDNQSGIIGHDITPADFPARWTRLSSAHG